MKKYTINFFKILKKENSRMKNLLLNNLTFKKISDENLDNLHNKLNIDKNIILSYRNQLLKNYVITNYRLIANKINNIMKEYKMMNILDLSKQYKFSPMSIMRLIIKEKYPKLKLSKDNINNLDDRDKQQLLIAEDNDIVSNLDQGTQQIKSEEYELVVQKFLDDNNIKFVTQEFLVEEQKKEVGYAYATPDFLLDDKIIFNNHIIKWIEVKNFYGSDVKFMNKKIQKQVDKYYKKWGFGCLVFRYGVYEDIKINNCIVISF